MRILHIISSLGSGGAENVLFQLCKENIDNDHHIISLSKNNCFYYDKFLEINCKVTFLNFRGIFNIFISLLKLFSLIRRGDYFVIQTWMYHSDLIGGICAKLAGHKNIVWNVRNTNFIKSKVKFSTKLFIYFSIYLSKYIPNKIIYCSKSAYLDHKKLGYSCKNSKVINNGIDSNKYKIFLKNDKNYSYHKKFDFIIGMVARFNFQKDHLNCIKSISLIKKSGLNPLLILIGKDCDINNSILMSWIHNNNLTDNIILCNFVESSYLIYSQFDIYLSSSCCGEGFPNVIAEAMACGIPCVSTDVGDSREIIAESGWTVPPSNSIELSNAILKAYAEYNDKDKWLNRQYLCNSKIFSRFSLSNMVEQYILYWQEDL